MALIIDNPIKKGDIWLIDFSYNPKKVKNQNLKLKVKLKN
ncbi:MAG: hypothetical protein AD073_000293 [Mycoplasmataceae bacterium]|nr:MAG: hypothetical protein AD073_000293 [Mycoplasmataceae bacterium]